MSLRLGAHLPTGKSLIATVERALELRCDCLQIFTKSPRIWNAAPLDESKSAAFREAWNASGLRPLVAHDSYLINLASADETIRSKSIAAMIDEIERADIMGCDWLVTHCGAHGGTKDQSDTRPPITPDESAGLERFVAGLGEVFRHTPEARVRIALENTAAPGTALGGPFEHLQYFRDHLPAQRIGFCFDTCHAFAAGHDLSTPAAVAQTFANWDEKIGIEKIAVVHLNDSKGVLGKRLDRHEHIGAGAIGREGMGAILNHPQLQNTPFILETPETETMIETNLKNARDLHSET